MWKSVVFTFGTIILVIISRASLRNPRSHGFYRFLAWEAILALFLLNADSWLIDPFSELQIIAWTLLIASLIPLGFGIQGLRSQGKPIQERKGDPSLLAFEKTTALVTTGIYRYIRHPLYSSLLLLTWGIYFKNLSMLSLLLAILATIFLLLTSRADEKECIRFFGADYRTYMQHTKRFIPFVF